MFRPSLKTKSSSKYICLYRIFRENLTENFQETRIGVNSILYGMSMIRSWCTVGTDDKEVKNALKTDNIITVNSNYSQLV